MTKPAGGKRERAALTSTDPTADRVAKLRELFPDVFAEGKVDFDKLRAALGDADAVAGGPERFTFSWAGRADAAALLRIPSRATLSPKPDQSVNWDTTRNLFVEGDNLEVLKLLYKAYSGKVTLIYIDPPYNTGNDFVYPDDFADPLAVYLKLTGQAPRPVRSRDGDGCGLRAVPGARLPVPRNERAGRCCVVRGGAPHAIRGYRHGRGD